MDNIPRGGSKKEMNKLATTGIVSGVIGLMCFVSLICLSGCQINEQQMKVIADQAGMFTAVTWIASVDNNEQIKEGIKDIVVIIKKNLTNVKQGTSYSSSFYDLISSYDASGIDSNYIPLIRAGSLAMLNGIDILLVTYPEWKNREEITTSIVIAFCNGVLKGFSFSDDSEIMKICNQSYQLQLQIKE